MKLDFSVIEAEVVNQCNRLIIEARLEDGSIVPVFCASDEAISLCCPQTRIYISPLQNARYIGFELQFVNLEQGLIFVNPQFNRRLFHEAFESGRLSDFAAYSSCREIEPDEELKHVDFELSSSEGGKCFVFIQNIFIKACGYAVFPAAINFFELEMFEEMEILRKQGCKTAVFMLVSRCDCSSARFSWKLDPVAAAKIFDQAKNGLNFVCYSCQLDKRSVTITSKMNIEY